jgi:hypothetical protein
VLLLFRSACSSKGCKKHNKGYKSITKVAKAQQRLQKHNKGCKSTSSSLFLHHQAAKAPLKFNMQHTAHRYEHSAAGRASTPRCSTQPPQLSHLQLAFAAPTAGCQGAVHLQPLLPPLIMALGVSLRPAITPSRPAGCGLVCCCLPVQRGPGREPTAPAEYLDLCQPPPPAQHHTCHTHVTHMSHTCHTHVTHMSHTCHTHVTHMSHTCHTHVTRMSHTCHTHVTHGSCGLQTKVIQLVGSPATDCCLPASLL